MRIEVPREFERLGAVRIYGLQKIYELDAGAEAASKVGEVVAVQVIPRPHDELAGLGKWLVQPAAT